MRRHAALNLQNRIDGIRSKLRIGQCWPLDRRASYVFSAIHACNYCFMTACICRQSPSSSSCVRVTYQQKPALRKPAHKSVSQRQLPHQYRNVLRVVSRHVVPLLLTVQ